MAIKRDFIEVTVRYLRDEKTRKLLGCNLVMADGTIYKTIMVDKPFKVTFWSGEFSISRSYLLHVCKLKNTGTTHLFLHEKLKFGSVEYGNLLFDGEVICWVQSLREYLLDYKIITFKCRAENLLASKLIELGISPERVNVEEGTEVVQSLNSLFNVFYTDATDIIHTDFHFYETRGATYCVVFSKDECSNSIGYLLEINVASSVMDNPESLEYIARLAEDVINGKHRRHFQKSCKSNAANTV